VTTFKHQLAPIFFTILCLNLLFLNSCSQKEDREAITYTSANRSTSEKPKETLYSCENLPIQFDSYQSATLQVKNATFPVEESINTSRSSWVRAASYFSCDHTFGFLIITTDSRNYIYQEVPQKIWQAFQNANSFGSYYNQWIKGRYPVRLKR
jgi:hypothetical protein